MLTITLLGTAATMPLPDRALSTAFAACGLIEIAITIYQRSLSATD